MTIKVSQRVKRFASRYAFEFFLEVMHDSIIEGFKKYLSPINPEDVRRMVREGTFPPTENVDFSAVTDHADFLEGIGELRLMEDFLAKARPDLAKAIIDMDAAGAEWVVKLRQHLLEKVRHPEAELAKSTDYVPKKDTVLLTCDKCKKQWPVAKDQAAAVKECPFCHQT